MSQDLKTQQRSSPIGVLPRGGVLAAVSGGADSTALAVLLADVGPGGGGRGIEDGPLALAHVRHGFRKDAAEVELELVQALARNIGTPLHVVELAPPASWKAGDKVPEAWAREQRYGALFRLARDLGIGTVATAHHAGDRRETQLLHVLRGGRLRALLGLAERRPADEGGLTLWRPLLAVEPERLRELLRERGIRWSEDASNRDLRLARNRVRHVLVPELRKRGDPLLARADEIARLAGKALDRLARECDRLLDRGQGVAIRAEKVVGLRPALGRELLEAAARRIAPGRALRARRRELESVVAWMVAEESRGERRIGWLGLAKTRDALAFVR